MLTVGSLFSGIGGIDLGLERAGMHITWQVENNPWCQRVLRRHWPHTHLESDIHGCGSHNLEPVDVICGGFPCQPVSNAGKRLAQKDARWLWPEFARIVRELRPRHVLVENVPGLLSRGMGDVVGDLAASGYDTEWDCIPAAAVGAPHRRDRLWIVAYPSWDERRKLRRTRQRTVDGCPSSRGTLGLETVREETATDAARIFGRARLRQSKTRTGEGRFDVTLTPDRDWWSAEPDVGRVAHGIPARVDRLRGLGNAVVPQVVEWIGRQIIAHSEGD